MERQAINMKSNKLIIFLLSTGILLLCARPVFAQSGGTDLNAYYSYDASAGAYYHQLSGIGNKALADFSIHEISGELRVPIPGLPILQPLVRGGYLGYTFTGDIDELNQDWTHFHAFGNAGLAYSMRLSREFELGAEIFAGISQSYFTELVINDVKETQGQLNFMAGLSGRFGLNPSYNISISINPALNYLFGLGPLHDYDGFTFGVGFAGTFRFGDDPETVGSTIKAIRFDNIDLPPLFAAMQSYYVKNPAGSLRITNKEKYPLDGISLSFMQPGFMDSPTPIAQDISIKPGESMEVPLPLVFNNTVFSTEGVIPLTGEIMVNYRVRGREIEQRKSVTYELHDKHSLTWDDDRKAAAFITSQDSAVRNFSSHIRQIHRDELNPCLSAELQFAIQAYNSLGEIGILYQIDPTAPFTEVQGDTFIVDSISLPRETLKRLTGDCDDLTVLYCTMLESTGVQTALVTVPGHIFCAFNTGISSADFMMIDPERSRIIEVDGELWIPLEITMIGKSSFSEAWNRGSSEFEEWENAPGRRGFYRTGEAQQVFRPVVLTETDLGLQYGDSEAIIATFRDDLKTLSQDVLNPARVKAETENSSKAWNTYGIAAAKLGSYGAAETAFRKAIDTDGKQLGPQLNLGSLYLLNEKYSAALELFKGIEKTAETEKLSTRRLFSLYLNLSKTYRALEKDEESVEYHRKAMELDPGRASDFSYVGNRNSTDRASGGTLLDTVHFFD